MAGRKFSAPKLYIEHEPESSNEIDGNGVGYQQELPGFLEIGVEVDGHRIPLHRLKAGSLLPAIDAAKAKGKEPAADAEPDTPES